MKNERKKKRYDAGASVLLIIYLVCAVALWMRPEGTLSCACTAFEHKGAVPGNSDFDVDTPSLPSKMPVAKISDHLCSTVQQRSKNNEVHTVVATRTSLSGKSRRGLFFFPVSVVGNDGNSHSCRV